MKRRRVGGGGDSGGGVIGDDGDDVRVRSTEGEVVAWSHLAFWPRRDWRRSPTG